MEPYFRLEQLMDIAEFDNIERVLVGPDLKQRDLEILATGLAALPSTRTLEVRVATSLHDRYLIPREEGRVTMLGLSLGGIGKKVSTIATLGELASNALRDAHEDLWRDAQVLMPKTSAKRTRKSVGKTDASQADPLAGETVDPRRAGADSTATPRKSTSKR